VTTNLPDPDQRPPAFWSVLKYESVTTLRARPLAIYVPGMSEEDDSSGERSSQMQEFGCGVGSPARSLGTRTGARTQSERILERVPPSHSPDPVAVCPLDLLVPNILIRGAFQ
jgi:hypothetical protein